jgi:hypothetical protein
MGHATYSVVSRVASKRHAFYASATTDQVFEQNVKQMIHEMMDPKAIKIREARDSDLHPNSIPIITALDVTGSMRHIPHYLIKDGLPKMIGRIIQGGVPDPALLFLAIGDHECDRAPLQVGQFESGDAELDTWLTRTYLEGGGGGNAGESYLLAWYFAAYHTASDAWDKRQQKGFLFTIGDEPCLDNLPKNILDTLMEFNSSQSTLNADNLLKVAQERYNVYHLHILEGSSGSRSLAHWKERLGQNCIVIEKQEDVARVIAEIVVHHAPKTAAAYTPDADSDKITL